MNPAAFTSDTISHKFLDLYSILTKKKIFVTNFLLLMDSKNILHYVGTRHQRHQREVDKSINK